MLQVHFDIGITLGCTANDFDRSLIEETTNQSNQVLGSVISLDDWTQRNSIGRLKVLAEIAP